MITAGSQWYPSGSNSDDSLQNFLLDTESGGNACGLMNGRPSQSNNKLYITGTTQGQMGDSGFVSNNKMLLVYDLDGTQEQII